MWSSDSEDDAKYKTYYHLDTFIYAVTFQVVLWNTDSLCKFNIQQPPFRECRGIGMLMLLIVIYNFT